MSASPDSVVHELRTRKRHVLDKWTDLPACDACFTRKVKCARLDIGRSDCETCKERNKPCQTLRENRYKPRAKKRKLPSDSPQEQAVISHHSPDSGLQRIELTESFMSELLASFFQHSDEQTPYADFDKLQIDFEQAGRRLDQLDPNTEPLILAMMACSAQYTDSHILLGSNAPRLDCLNSLQEDFDLLQFGHRRQALCEDLVVKVLHLVDSRGLFRKANSKSISTLMMLPRVLRHPARIERKGLDYIEDTWRPFVSAALSHIRTLYEQHGPVNVDIGRVQWPLVIGDACHSAFTGYSLMVTEDDLEQFPHMTDIPAPTVDIIHAYILSNDIREVMFILMTFGNAIVNNARTIAKTISTPIQQKRQVKLSTFLDRIRDARNCISILSECQQIAQTYEPLMIPFTLQRQRVLLGAPAPTLLRYGLVTPALLVPALHQQFEKYEMLYDLASMSDDAKAAEILARGQVRREIDIGLVDSILVVARTIRELEGKDVVASLTRQTSLLVSIQDSLVMYINLAFGVLPAEDGGSSSVWTRQLKSDTLRLLIDAARLQVWAWSDREADVISSERRYQEYLNSIQFPPSPSVLKTPAVLFNSTDSQNSFSASAFEAQATETHPSGLVHLVEPAWALEYADLWATNIPKKSEHSKYYSN